MSEWRPIETAPRDGTKILAYGCMSGDYGYTDDEWYIDVVQWGGGYLDGSWMAHTDARRYSGGFSPTHWQPLPQPPKENA